MTALGAGAVFLTREVNRKLLDAMLGFAAGVMIAASYWSLLARQLLWVRKELFRLDSSCHWFSFGWYFSTGDRCSITTSTSRFINERS
jgi:zinc transporter ZupT